MDLKELLAKLDALRKKTHKVFEQAGKDLDFSKVDCISGSDTRAKIRSMGELNSEMNDVAKQIEEVKTALGAKATADAMAKIIDAPVKGLKHPAAPAKKGDGKDEVIKGLGDLFVESKGYTERQGRIGPEASIESGLKAVFSTSAGFAPESLRTGKIQLSAQRPIQVVDAFPDGRTGFAQIVYMEETTFTNAAAETAEGALAPEAELVLTERTEPVRKISVFLPVTEEQLEDEAAARSYLNQRLPFMIRQRLDNQLLNGNGTPPNLEGVLQRSGLLTQAKGGDPVPDAIFKALTKVRLTGRAFPNWIMIHQTDWETIRLLKTADGIYLWGSPAETGDARIWGLPVIQTDTLSVGTALVGDFANHSQLFERRGMKMKISDSHSDFFQRGQLAIRVDIRVALAVYRPQGFATVTGL